MEGSPHSIRIIVNIIKNWYKIKFCEGVNHELIKNNSKSF